MEGKQRTYFGLRTVLHLIGRNDLCDFYVQNPTEAVIAVNAAAVAFRHSYSENFRSSSSMAALLRELNGLGEPDIDQLLYQIGHSLSRMLPSLDKNLNSGELSTLRELTTPAEMHRPPKVWEQLVTQVGHSKSAARSFMLAFDAALVARALKEPDVATGQSSALQIDALPGLLKEFVRLEDPPGEILGAKEASVRLGVSLVAVHEWMRTGKLVGWARGTNSGEVIPAEQILGKGNVVPGLEKIFAHIGQPELVWDFLSREWPFEDKVARPIELLRSGNSESIQAVLDAAPAYGNSST